MIGVDLILSCRFLSSDPAFQSKDNNPESKYLKNGVFFVVFCC